MSKPTQSKELKYLKDCRKRQQGYCNDLANLDIKIREELRRLDLRIKKLEKTSRSYEKELTNNKYYHVRDGGHLRTVQYKAGLDAFLDKDGTAFNVNSNTQVVRESTKKESIIFNDTIELFFKMKQEKVDK